MLDDPTAVTPWGLPLLLDVLALPLVARAAREGCGAGSRRERKLRYCLSHSFCGVPGEDGVESSVADGGVSASSSQGRLLPAGAGPFMGCRGLWDNVCVLSGSERVDPGEDETLEDEEVPRIHTRRSEGVQEDRARCLERCCNCVGCGSVPPTGTADRGAVAMVPCGNTSCSSSSGPRGDVVVAFWIMARRNDWCSAAGVRRRDARRLLGWQEDRQED